MNVDYRSYDKKGSMTRSSEEHCSSFEAMITKLCGFTKNQNQIRICVSITAAYSAGLV